MTPDTSQLGDWADLPFFTKHLPGIEARLAQETVPIYPRAEAVFAALARCQEKNVRVVILGQDPYHTPGKADGLAFSIPQDFGGRLDSLGNIFKELHSDLGITRKRTNLDDWAKQGVLLLNTSLTVLEGKAGAHAKIGWQHLVTEVLAHLAHRPRAYLLWGAHAHKVAATVDATANLKIETAHPSPLSAARGFFGSRPFSRVNQWLKDRQDTEINWAGPQ